MPVDSVGKEFCDDLGGALEGDDVLCGLSHLPGLDHFEHYMASGTSNHALQGRSKCTRSNYQAIYMLPLAAFKFSFEVARLSKHGSTLTPNLRS